jgi:hypothetical protein
MTEKTRNLPHSRVIKFCSRYNILKQIYIRKEKTSITFIRAELSKNWTGKLEQTISVLQKWAKCDRNPQRILISRTQDLLLYWGGPNLVWCTATWPPYPSQQCLADWWIALARMISLLPSLPTSELHSLILIHGDTEDKAPTHTQLALHRPLHRSQYWAAIYMHTEYTSDGKIHTCTSVANTRNSTLHLLLRVMSGPSARRAI